MSREVRRVPADWKHPEHTALLKGPFSKALADWIEGEKKWEEGFRTDFRDGWKPRDDTESESFDEWWGPKPQAEDYMPEWPAEQCTHLMMYETCSEGTPISPACATPEELAHWLANNGASAFGRETASYEQWLATCKAGWAPTAVFSAGTGLVSGVAAAVSA